MKEVDLQIGEERKRTELVIFSTLATPALSFHHPVTHVLITFVCLFVLVFSICRLLYFFLARAIQMEIKKQNMVTEGAFEGEAQGRSVQAFMNALPEQFSAEQKLGLWTRLRDLEGSAMLYSKVARIEMNTPGTEVKKFEVNVGTGAPQEFMSKNVRGRRNRKTKKHQAAHSGENIVSAHLLTFFSSFLRLLVLLCFFLSRCCFPRSWVTPAMVAVRCLPPATLETRNHPREEEDASPSGEASKHVCTQ